MEQGVSDGPLWTLSLAKGSSNVVWLAIESAQSASSSCSNAFWPCYRRLFHGYKRTIVTNSKQFQDEDRLEELRITVVLRPCTGTTEKSQKEIHE